MTDQERQQKELASSIAWWLATIVLLWGVRGVFGEYVFSCCLIGFGLILGICAGSMWPKDAKR